MDYKFFDSLFSGDSDKGCKLCLGLTDGDFWARINGIAVLYENKNLKNILAVSNIGQENFYIKTAATPNSRNTFILRRVNGYGREEKTYSAAVNADFDSCGNLIKRYCNKIFIIEEKQINTDKVLITWFYNSLKHNRNIKYFAVYSDNAGGYINYQNPIKILPYKGRKFYKFQSENLSQNTYKFAIRAVAAENKESNFKNNIAIRLDRNLPQMPFNFSYELL